MKNRYPFLAVLAAVSVSCSIHEVDNKGESPRVFYAQIEVPSGMEQTKVYVDDDLSVLWHADDRVSIFDKNTFNQEYRFTGKTGAKAGAFEKVGNNSFITGNALSSVYSLYPYKESTEISNQGVLSIDLPAIQSYSQNSFGLEANTMVSVTSDNNLMFKNVCGYLRLRLYGEGVSVSAVTLKGNNGEKLAGNAAVTMLVDGVPSVRMASDAATEVTVFCETPVELGAEAAEGKAFWFVIPPVTFSGGFTVSVTESNGCVFEKSTSKSVSIDRNNVSTMAALEVAPIPAPYPIPEMVDLGLSVKWASFNLGASAPEEYGDYFAWGETEPHYMPGYAQSSSPVWREGKEGYNASTYQWSEDGYLTKYCNDPEIGFHGFTDQKTMLDPEDDAATVHLGGQWRMPTFSEAKELAIQCTWEWVTVNGVNGRKVTGPNGNSIFLPAAGYRGGRYGLSFSGLGASAHYRLSLIDPTSPRLSWTLYFDEFMDRNRYSEGRMYGMTIRPVHGKLISAESVSLNYASLTLQKGSTETLTAVVSPSNATEKEVVWTSDKPSVASVSELGVVKANSVGTATIVATTDDGGFKAECVVTVLENAVP